MRIPPAAASGWVWHNQPAQCSAQPCLRVSHGGYVLFVLTTGTAYTPFEAIQRETPVTTGVAGPVPNPLLVFSSVRIVFCQTHPIL